MKREEVTKLSLWFNTLSVAVALALTGLIVFYLPDVVQRPFNWKPEGHLIGLALAVLGVFAILMSARKITARESFRSWALGVGAASVAFVLLAVARNVSVPRWLAVTMLVVAITAIMFAIYELVLGFSQLFDDNLTVRVWPRAPKQAGAQGGSGDGQHAAARQHRRLSWYERVTLMVATVAALATVVAAAVSYVPPSHT
jgi:hypothetical protein